MNRRGVICTGVAFSGRRGGSPPTRPELGLAAAERESRIVRGDLAPSLRVGWADRRTGRVSTIKTPQEGSSGAIRLPDRRLTKVEKFVAEIERGIGDPVRSACIEPLTTK